MMVSLFKVPDFIIHVLLVAAADVDDVADALHHVLRLTELLYLVIPRM